MDEAAGTKGAKTDAGTPGAVQRSSTPRPTRTEIEASRAAAVRKAQILFGDGAIVGYNPQYPDKPCFVGKRIRGVFVQFGAGDSWDAAFAAVKDVIDLGNGRFKAR